MAKFEKPNTEPNTLEVCVYVCTRVCVCVCVCSWLLLCGRVFVGALVCMAALVVLLRMPGDVRQYTGCPSRGRAVLVHAHVS